MKNYQFCVEFIFVVAKYVFLTCTLPVVEIEVFAAVLPKLKSIINMILNPHYQIVELFSFKIKTMLSKELNKNFA